MKFRGVLLLLAFFLVLGFSVVASVSAHQGKGLHFPVKKVLLLPQTSH